MPYDDEREASTTEEETATFNAAMEREAKIDQQYRRILEK